MQMERRLRAASGQMGLRRPLVRTRAQAAVWEAFLVSWRTPCSRCLWRDKSAGQRMPRAADRTLFPL